MLHHRPGDTDKPVSTPRTVTSHGDDGLRVPRASLKSMSSELRSIRPELAEITLCPDLAVLVKISTSLREALVILFFIFRYTDPLSGDE